MAPLAAKGPGTASKAVAFVAGVTCLALSAGCHPPRAVADAGTEAALSGPATVEAGRIAPAQAAAPPSPAPAIPSSPPLPAVTSRYPKIDVHMHIGPDGIPRAMALMN